MQPGKSLLAVLFLALVLRSGAAWYWVGDLTVDRDAYGGIARSLVEGRGYSTPGTNVPTAYRPPLYPLVLAGIAWLGGSAAGIGVLHVVLGTATVWLTYLLGRRLASERVALVAAGLTAVDPLLVRYTAVLMTETLTVFLVTLLLVVALGASRLRPVWTGAVFGLAALCRPTVWAFGGLAGGWWLWKTWQSSSADARRQGLCEACLAVAASLLVVAPWCVRNAIVFGHAVFTTTHGGYTLLLGNNPVFYNEVVNQPWGTVWSEESHSAWTRSLERQMDEAVPPLDDEPAKDRWMYQRASENIARQPQMFLRACWLRFRRFWNIVPQGEAASEVPAPVRWGTGLFYVVVYCGLALAVPRSSREDRRRWMPLVLLMGSFTFVHLFYWSNARMRIPVIPAIAVLAGCGLAGRRATDSEAAAALAN